MGFGYLFKLEESCIARHLPSVVSSSPSEHSADLSEPLGKDCAVDDEVENEVSSGAEEDGDSGQEGSGARLFIDPEHEVVNTDSGEPHEVGANEGEDDLVDDELLDGRSDSEDTSDLDFGISGIQAPIKPKNSRDSGGGDEAKVPSNEQRGLKPSAKERKVMKKTGLRWDTIYREK